MSIFTKIFGDPNRKILSSLKEESVKINEWESKIKGLTDEKLKGKTFEFRERLKKGEPLESLLFEAFACVREAARRTLGQRHYDVQLIAGIVLHVGKIE